jgi:hypothetical protein
MDSVPKPGNSNTVGELTGQWQRVVCTLRSNGYFSQADAEVRSDTDYV